MRLVKRERVLILYLDDERCLSVSKVMFDDENEFELLHSRSKCAVLICNATTLLYLYILPQTMHL